MLVLTRSPGETIMVGDNIQVTYFGDNKWEIVIMMDGKKIAVQYLGTKRGEGSFGITAPIEINIFRPEAHTNDWRVDNETTKE